jgi:hypothetical protein
LFGAEKWGIQFSNFFLLSMNEVNIELILTDFVISKKKNYYRFSGRIGTFYRNAAPSEPSRFKKNKISKIKKTKNPYMIFCFRAQAATVALISHFKILTYEEL